MFEDDRDEAAAEDGGDGGAAENGRHETAGESGRDEAVGEEGGEDADEQPTDLVEETLEASPHEPDPPSFDVTSGQDLVDDLPSGSEVSSNVRRSFWEMVVLLKIALLALSLGILLAYFRGRIDVAAGLGLVAAVAGLRLLWRVRSYDDDRDDS